MKPPTRYLKPAWARLHLEKAAPLLPTGAGATLLLAGKPVVTLGTPDQMPSETAADSHAIPLTAEGEPLLGMLLLRPPHGGDPGPTHAWGDLVAHGLQSFIDATHARHAVAKEALESYREIALLQRAVTELNRSLKPSAVAEALLKEFDDGKGATTFGAVFLNDEECAATLIQSFGEGAPDRFSRLAAGRLFGRLLTSPHGDIINNLTADPLWDDCVPGWHALLWLPLGTHGDNLGLLVLASENPAGFSAADMKRAQVLASVAATALRNAQLYAAEQNMFQSFVRVIATAIDAKSPYTAGHCRRVPEIALMLAEKAHRSTSGIFAGFTLDENERSTIEIAAILHDCGKVVTPEWIINKATKLDAIVNRLELVALRFELLRRDALAERERRLAIGENIEKIDSECQEHLQTLTEDFAFLKKCNLGEEVMSADHIARINVIAARRWRSGDSQEYPLLDADEAHNLCTPRGTLNPEERKIIEDHAVHTITMLSEIAFPNSLRNVVEYAANHHERMDGKGYPRGLGGEQLSIPARIVAIADIFEALTAPDRPYRKPGRLDWAVDTMHRMRQDGHIDGDLFELFLAEGVYWEYAQRHLSPNQIEQIDVARYLVNT